MQLSARAASIGSTGSRTFPEQDAARTTMAVTEGTDYHRRAGLPAGVVKIVP
jgi:hypothetical protein